MSIYTRTGDSGQTSLFSGERVYKDHLRVEAYGTLDELNSVLGLAACYCRDDRLLSIVGQLQKELFVAGADLSNCNLQKSDYRIREENWKTLEVIIDELTSRLPKLKDFILPGGSSGAALLHVARTTCRRAERLIVRLHNQREEINPALLVYVNRLSDLFFTMARYENMSTGVGDKLWQELPDEDN